MSEKRKFIPKEEGFLAPEDAERDATEFFEQKRSPMFAIAYGMTGNRQDAEDIVSIGMAQVWTMMSRGDFPRDAGEQTAYMYSIISSRARDLLRSKETRAERTHIREIPLGLIRESNIEDQVLTRLMYEDAVAALQKTPKEQREVIFLGAIGYSDGDIASKNGISPSTVKGRARLAKAKVRAKLDHYFEK